MNDLAQLTKSVAGGAELTAAAVAEVINALLSEAVPNELKAEFLTALARKGETPAEIAAFARDLRDRAVNPGLDPAAHAGVLMDLCGTGADMAHTFNISSAVMFVVAAAGVPVVKHGNRAITSRCGSADVLLALGARIELPPAAARACLEQTGVTFLFAPLYHPAFKQIAPVRKLLGERKQRTVFNILGPLVNPARPTHQVVGIFDKQLVGAYAEVLRLLGLQRALVVHGAGLDEFSTMGVNTVAELWGGRVEVSERSHLVPHTQPRVMPVTLAELAGGEPPYCAAVIRAILDGTDRGPRRDIVLLNAAAALVVAEQAPDFATGWARAAELIDNGAARAKLDAFVECSQAQ